MSRTHKTKKEIRIERLRKKFPDYWREKPRPPGPPFVWSIAMDGGMKFKGEDLFKVLGRWVRHRPPPKS